MKLKDKIQEPLLKNRISLNPVTCQSNQRVRKVQMRKSMKMKMMKMIGKVREEPITRSRRIKMDQISQ